MAGHGDRRYSLVQRIARRFGQIEHRLLVKHSFAPDHQLDILDATQFLNDLQQRPVDLAAGASASLVDLPATDPEFGSRMIDPLLKFPTFLGIGLGEKRRALAFERLLLRLKGSLLLIGQGLVFFLAWA